jgi:putative heme-binding domain-containing protein
MTFQKTSCKLFFFCWLIGSAVRPTLGQEVNPFARDNLVAWCIVPFDARKRGPEDRAVMLEKLGFKRFAYDWRAEHIPTFDAEMEALKKHGIKLEAFWFPGDLNMDARTILDLLRRHKIQTQLWVTLGDPAPGKEQAAKVEAAVRLLRPIAEEAAKISCTVALYNHGGWFGEPENQLAIIEQLKLANVGIVYNLHHGHAHLDRFPALLKRMLPHLKGLNLNGMVKDGDQVGKKILPLGQGELDLDLLRTIRASGYRGPIGILGHTMDDAEDRLRDNLDGLAWLLPQLDGKTPGPKPKPRTYSAANPEQGKTPGWLAEGKAEYRMPPLTLECRARLNSKTRYNILVASDTKRSGAHWELFTMTGTGKLAVYLPGMQPDHVHSEANVCDGQWHDLAMQYEPGRVRLYRDGKMVAEQAVKSKEQATVAGGLAFARLVEGDLGCDGTLQHVRLSRGIRPIQEVPQEPLKADEQTIGLWHFDRPGQQVEDLSKLKNPAKKAAAAPPSQGAMPPPGLHLKPADPRLKAVLIDRSANDAYMGVKVDGAGRLFVGGRQAVFVFEPNAKGGYEPRRELCHFPQDSIIIGIEIRGNDLYVLTSSALYLLPEGRVKREGIKPKRLVWGLPLDLHVSFHCLAWGPEGDLYLSHGDPLLNYGDWSTPDHWGHWTLFTQPEGTKVPYTGVGGILRVRPDGSGLQVVAGGFRGPVGLAFDRQWNLFSNDNDHESRADLYAPARLMHVTPHADFAWPRGWLASKNPDRSDLLDLMTDDLGRGVPCGLAYYDEPYLADVVRHSLLLCRWDRMAVTRCPLQRRGASFKTEEHDFLIGDNNARPVGITVGRDGRVFVTALYLGGNVVSPYCPSDLVMITRSDDAPTHPFKPYDVTSISAERLWDEVGSPALERRSRAHVEILRRGGKELDRALVGVFDDKKSDRFTDLIWLAGTSHNPEAGHAIATAATQGWADLRLQAIRVLTEFRHLTAPREVLVNALGDDEPQVQLAALAYFQKAKGPLPVEQVVKLARSPDTYLRQVATHLLARQGSFAHLRTLDESKEEAVRLAGVLAAGIRLTVPPVHETPPTEVPLFYPAGNAFFHTKLKFADRDDEVDLRDLGRVGSYTTAQRWKAVKPSEEQTQLFDLLVKSLGDTSPRVRLQAAYYLSLLHDPRSDPLVAKVRQDIRFAAVAGLPLHEVNRVWTVGAFADGPRGLAQPHPPEQGAIDLAAAYSAGEMRLRWQETAGKAGRIDTDGSTSSSRYFYFRLHSGTRQLALLLHPEEGVRVWHNGQPIESGRPGKAVLDLQPGSNDVLVRVHFGDRVQPVELRFRASEGVSASLPEKLDASLLAQRLKDAGGEEKVSPEFLVLDWPQEVRRGDPGRGRQLFASLGCVKCHAITADQKGNGAPSLTDSRRRFTVPYLVESILLPSKQVAAPFRGTTITTRKGQVVAGLVVNENAESLELLLPDATRKTISKKDVEERNPSKVSPMPAGLVKAPGELRDLLAYLLSENPTPP